MTFGRQHSRFIDPVKEAGAEYSPSGAADTHEGVGENLRIAWLPVLLTVAALSFNGVLAIVNAHGPSLTITQVALAEFGILAAVALSVIAFGLRVEDTPPVGLGVAFLLLAIGLSFANGGFAIEALRNVTIIVLFTMLGMRCNMPTIRAAFVAGVGLVVAVMLMEIASTELYAKIFSPFSYYQNTRGLGDVDQSDIGLFGNALGFEGRFSFGLFTTPRTSSIFIEQTSMANFASVVAIYVVAMWDRIGWAERALTAGFVLLALLSNNTRLGSTLAVLTLAGYWLYPRLPRAGLLLFPLVLLGLATALSAHLGPSKEDDLAGRIGLSVDFLAKTDMAAVLGGRVWEAGRFVDSGYSYVLYSSSLAGAILLWLYVGLVIPFRSPEQRRCAWATGVFLFVNLLIAGNAVFSTKVSAMMWLLAGFMRAGSFAPAAAPPKPRAVRRFGTGFSFPAHVRAPSPLLTGGSMQDGLRR
ncbi:putative polymerase [Sphingomonas carotinifaciens]|uniref:Putative polymerase n=1 Tax=Sphingomonas carotinifaciens TaxID=1166323 RepID=A0A1G7QBG3_9SPHN|nr:putative polymerase [Sphingomonas carotinifaciens]